MSKIEYLSPTEVVSMADSWFEVANKSHFWIKWRYDALSKLRKHLPKVGTKVFEIGCGTCIFSSQLEDSGYIADACDLNELALKASLPLNGDKYIYNIYDQNPKLLKKYDAIYLMDVIEHIDDHVSFLKAATNHLKSGGIVVINVPAHDFLFSKYDEVAGHKRRYNLSSLNKLANEAGLEWVDGKYWGLFLVPVLFMRNLVLKFVSTNVIEVGFAPPNKFVHFIFQILRKAEYFLPFKMPTGTSVLAICRAK